MRITPDRDRPSRSNTTTTTAWPARTWSSNAANPGPVLPDPREPVREDPPAPGGGQRGRLRPQRLVIGLTYAYPTTTA